MIRRRLSPKRNGPTARNRRPYLIDAEDFDFMDDHELSDWMLGQSGGEQTGKRP